MFTIRIKTERFMDRIFCLCFRQKSWYNAQSFGPNKKRSRVPETLSNFYFKHGSRGKVEKFNNSKCDTLSSESYRIVVKVKVKQSRYRPGVAQRVPGT